MSKDIKVRIAPSPTGDPSYVGTAGLFNYAFVKHNGGKFYTKNRRYW